ncbi:unnamed protein product [Effrenium voratum]|nr:unnamed protein product [Effrenium voratum]
MLDMFSCGKEMPDAGRGTLNILEELLQQSQQSQELAELQRDTALRQQELGQALRASIAAQKEPFEEMDEIHVVSADAEHDPVSIEPCKSTEPMASKEASWLRSLTWGEEDVEQEVLTLDIVGLRAGSMSRASHAQSMRSQAKLFSGAAQWTLNRAATLLHAIESIKEPVRTGWLAELMRSSSFNLLSLLVIVANAAYITVMTDYELLHAGQQVGQELGIEFAFSAFYLLELIAKLTVHRLYYFWTQEWLWNVFDFVLVVLVLVENGVTALSAAEVTGSYNIMFLRVLRLFKLARVFRIFRTLRFFTELRLMMECVAGSLMNAIWCVVLLFFTKYIFALLIAQSLVGHWIEVAGTENAAGSSASAELLRLYPSVSQIMVTLLQSTTSGLDWQEPFGALKPTGFALPALFVAFILVFTVSIWNIVTSVFVEKALKLATPDLDALVLEQNYQEKKLCEELITFFSSRSEDDCISPKAFRSMAEDASFRGYLTANGIDIKNIQIFFSMLASAMEDGEDVDIHLLANACVRMRGFATSIDLQSLSFETKIMHRKQVDMVKVLAKHLKRVEGMLKQMMLEPERGLGPLDV